MEKDNEKLKFIDTHAHYYHSRFKRNLNDLMTQMEDDLEYIINLGTNTKSNINTMNLIKKYNYLYGMVGFFPSDVLELENKDILELFKKQLTNKKIVGIGEIGIDYYHNTPEHDLQIKWFKYQLDLAKELGLPVSIHSRDAEEDTIKVFKDYNNIKGVIHCFSYGMRSADIYYNKGLYFGIGGTSTYKNNKELREVIKWVPLDRVLLETDAPYLSPQEVRRETNISSNIKYVIKNISDIKGITEEEIIKQTNINAKTLFNFK